MNVFEALYEFKFNYLSGMGVTLLLSLFAVVLGVMRMSKIKPLRWFSITYIEIFRGTPLLVQLFIIYFGLTEFGLDLNKFTSGIIAVGLNSAAYLAEIFRAGIQGVDKGQVEASRSLGMTHAQTLRFVVLPQALRSVLPAIGNEFVTMIKETSIVNFIGIMDIMFETEKIRSITYSALGPLMGAAVCYFIMTFTLSKLIGRLERKMANND